MSHSTRSRSPDDENHALPDNVTHYPKSLSRRRKPRLARRCHTPPEVALQTMKNYALPDDVTLHPVALQTTKTTPCQTMSHSTRKSLQTTVKTTPCQTMSHSTQVAPDDENHALPDDVTLHPKSLSRRRKTTLARRCHTPPEVAPDDENHALPDDVTLHGSRSPDDENHALPDDVTLHPKSLSRRRKPRCQTMSHSTEVALQTTKTMPLPDDVTLSLSIRRKPRLARRCHTPPEVALQTTKNHNNARRCHTPPEVALQTTKTTPCQTMSHSTRSRSPDDENHALPDDVTLHPKSLSRRRK
ncbi:sialidase-like [Macrobrachium rosenbergii]|uniref:sialidase-like n=1 Tax=Macrobrachium rosenbergii TaxID=79674 RepID=UPI0034D60E72